ILASTLGYQLHQDYRRIPRPSSAPTTKSSIMRPKTLTHTCKSPDTNSHKGNYTNSKNKHARVHYAVHKHKPPTPTTTRNPTNRAPNSHQDQQAHRTVVPRTQQRTNPQHTSQETSINIPPMSKPPAQHSHAK